MGSPGFDRQVLTRCPYFFPALDGVTESAEQDAVDAGQLQPNGIRYVGHKAT